MPEPGNVDGPAGIDCGGAWLGIDICDGPVGASVRQRSQPHVLRSRIQRCGVPQVVHGGPFTDRLSHVTAERECASHTLHVSSTIPSAARSADRSAPIVPAEWPIPSNSRLARQLA
jgi:hypothetical protein